MPCQKLKLICFSPTRTTRRILDAIAEGIAPEELKVVDVSRLERVPECYGCDDEDLVIIGAPVYSGRIPLPAMERFMGLKADNVPAVLVVVYGNRAYEDALLELKDLAEGVGFTTVAASAFIGEHSFSTEATPIAVNRPDLGDIEEARAFGRAVVEKMENHGRTDFPEFEVPGNRPYKDRSPKADASPVSNGNCQLCGACERVCPVDAISVGAMVETDPVKCIFCCACVKVCAFDSRKMKIPKIIEISKWLADNFSERREPEIFI